MTALSRRRLFHANRIGSCHRIFRFHNEPAPLHHDRELHKRERVLRIEFCDFGGMRNRLIVPAQLLQVNAECQVRLQVVRMIGHNLLQCLDRSLKVAVVLQLIGGVVKVVGISSGV